ncbi:hypothetical protein niasHT_018603 [Heterodera trifolii]|uniref:Uncharacterized protein n=1 Tax=Heterodera trifolii TaxID=157864 RepID=A0ABD2LBJ7_9BILA
MSHSLLKRPLISNSPNQIPQKRHFLNEVTSMNLAIDTLDDDPSISPAARVIISQLSNLLKMAASIINNSVSDIDYAAEMERRRSVVITGLSENQSETPSIRAISDNNAVTGFLDQLGVETRSVVCYRMGWYNKVRATNGACRPIKVVLPASSFQRTCLHQWKKKAMDIRRQLDNKRLNIRESLTQEQLKARRELQAECAEKRKETSADWIIYNGEILLRSEIKERRRNEENLSGPFPRTRSMLTRQKN